MRQFRLVLVVIGLLVLAACGDGGGGGSDTTSAPGDTTDTTTASGEDLPVVRLQGLDGGMSALSIAMIEEQGFDVANGFQGEFQYIPIDAAAQHFLNGESDVSFDVGPPDLAVSQNSDYDVVAFSGGARNHNRIITKADSPYDSIEDLVGARIGHFGDDSTATLSISLLLGEFHDLDFHEDFELVLAAPPALVDLLASDEVDAIVSFEPHVSRAKATIEGGVKEIYNPGEDFSENVGGTLWTTTVGAFSDWIDENPDLAQAVLDAWCDAAEYASSNAEDVATNPAYDDLLGLNDDGKAEFQAFLESYQLFSCGWQEGEQEAVAEFLDLMAQQGVLFTEVPGEVTLTLEGSGG